MRRYPYDRILYHPGQLCGTCKLLKPARSKHCRICKVCVSRHDHHCVWLMCCVDRGNYVYFMSLLLSLTALTAYGCVVGFDILDEIVQEAYLGGYLGPVEAPRWTSGRDFFSKAELMGVAVGENLRVGSVSLLCFMCCPLPLAMFGYHVYLIWAGITTNETSKWEVWKELVAEKAAFAATKGEVYERILSYERETDWPAKSEQTLRCTRDARPPRVGYHYNDRLWEIVQPADEGAPEDSRWERVKDMTEVVNMYDMGFVANLRDALGMDVSKRP
ncbi:palmitoyltransferase swf1 [Ascosphaera atra]|nr:palmitoyltransferase swf1 [Ascosphaera atra]